MKRLCFLVLFFLASLNSYGATDTNVTITTFGVQSSSAYFAISPAPSSPCLYGILYVDLSSAYGKYLYAMLLSAKSSDLPLTRVDYFADGSGVCFVNLVSY